ncbi:MAG TPA: nucleotidyltransferase domain-containing protein [Chloroflexota bacterium]|nr:nucleotidyltransferase domain-containing protein [Chloroflexota bacterium]
MRRKAGGHGGSSRAAPPSDPVLDEIVRRLVDTLAPERVYLFGSRARGDAQEDSDYDILVTVRERTDEGRELEVRAYGAMWGLGTPVDIVIMTSDYFDWMLGAAASLPATVRREGRQVYAA